VLVVVVVVVVVVGGLYIPALEHSKVCTLFNFRHLQFNKKKKNYSQEIKAK
jgi:hypothetical protein